MAVLHVPAHLVLLKMLLQCEQGCLARRDEALVYHLADGSQLPEI